MARKVKRKPPTGGLSVEQLRAHAAARRGKPLKAAHKKAIAKGVMRAHAKRKGLTLAKYLKAKKTKK